MAHLHSVYDSDTHFSIDVITRTLKNESSKKTMVIQNDHNSERFTFELPRFIEGHDMMQCNKTEVHYLNIDTQKGTKVEGVYEVDDLQLSPANEPTEEGTEGTDEKVIFSWLISRNATQFVGSLNFVITFKCLDDEGMVQYAWNTAIHSRISVSSGIQNTKDIVLEYADVLEQWKNNLIAVEKSAKQFVDESVAEYVEAYPLMMQVADDHIQYKMGEVEWINVIALEDIKGDTGVGIQYVEQTTTSEEDDGNNVITFGLTDGSYHTFTVQNGSKGSQGIQGEAGVSPTFRIEQFEGGATIIATDINGSTTAKLYDGGGEDGIDGVGVQSIEQTTTSTEDDGNNVITVTLTNGKSHTFTVQNGSKGSDGSDGKTAYQYAKDGGYTGTEAAFTSLLGNINNTLNDINNELDTKAVITSGTTDLTAGTSELASGVIYAMYE